MSRIKLNTNRPWGQSRRAIIGWTVVFVALSVVLLLLPTEAQQAAAPIPQEPPSSIVPVMGYFGHLSEAQLPGVRLIGIASGETAFVSGDAAFTIPAGRSVPLRMSLSPSDLSRDSVGLRIHVDGVAGKVERTYWLSTHEWRTGGAYDWTASLRVPPFSFVGNGTLTIGYLLPSTFDAPRLGDGEAVPIDEAILFRAPVYAAAESCGSRLSQVTIDSAFGPSNHRLGRAFRLAPNTSIEIDVEMPGDAKCSGIGLVSALGGDFDFDQGESVVTITADTSDSPLHVRAGLETSFAQVDAPPPGVVRLDPVRVAVTAPAPFSNWQDESIDVALFASRSSFSESKQLTKLTFRYVASSGYIDIHDVVCLLNKPAGASE